VLTSRFDRSTPVSERRGRVRIVRAPVWFRVSKGVIMPTFGWLATRLTREHDVISLHLPQFDAAGVGLRGRLLRKPTTLTYHCDLSLPPGVFNRVANHAVDLMNHAAGRMCHRVIAYTEDYATHSPFLSSYRHKLTVIPPPVELAAPEPGAVEAFRARWIPPGAGPVIGMAARLATEKGVEVLVGALPRIVREFPSAVVLFAGQHEGVLGEAAYARRVAQALGPHQDRWRFTGVLDPAQMASFFTSIDVITVPSLNSTESFGLVQVEAMLAGTPRWRARCRASASRCCRPGWARSWRSGTPARSATRSSASSATGSGTCGRARRSSGGSTRAGRRRTTKRCSTS
jgi:glycosyltransferase involved in cell wall biosynthesis